MKREKSAQNVPMDLFGENLRNRAKQLGISNAEVARRLKIGERRYASYVVGDREPDLTTLIKIARVLGSDPNALLGFNQRPINPALSSAVDRIVTSLATLDPAVVEALAVQIEALAKQKRQPPLEKHDEL